MSIQALAFIGALFKRIPPSKSLFVSPSKWLHPRWSRRGNTLELTSEFHLSCPQGQCMQTTGCRKGTLMAQARSIVHTLTGNKKKKTKKIVFTLLVYHLELRERHSPQDDAKWNQFTANEQVRRLANQPTATAKKKSNSFRLMRKACINKLPEPGKKKKHTRKSLCSSSWAFYSINPIARTLFPYIREVEMVPPKSRKRQDFFFFCPFFHFSRLEDPNELH